MPNLDRRILLPLGAVVLGAANGLVFMGFEWLVKHGTDWLWNDVVGSDTTRWRVVPLAVVLSIVFSALLMVVRQERWIEPHLDPMAAAEGDGPPPSPPARDLAIILIVGVSSLIAGASLGPEAALVAFATGLGGWSAARAGLGEQGGVLVLASVGALLVAFFGSLIALILPVLVLFQKTRRLPIPALVLIAFSGLAAWGTLWAVQGNADGFGQIPPFLVDAKDYGLALVLGAIAVLPGLALRRCVLAMAAVTKRVAAGTAWWLAAAGFGLVIGLLYLVGGETVQFSGSEGSGMLLSQPGRYGAWALAGLVLVKLLVTAWSLAAGYRGGLIFPSVFVSIALALCVGAAIPDASGPGVMLGSLAGLLATLTSPVLGAVMLLALLPLKLIPLGITGIAGATIGGLAMHRLTGGASTRSHASGT